MTIAKNFEHGSSTFICGCCGRNTRRTTQPYGYSDCAHCFDLAGLQCMAWDGNLEDSDREGAKRVRNACIKAGGDAKKITNAFPELWET